MSATPTIIYFAIITLLINLNGFSGLQIENLPPCPRSWSDFSECLVQQFTILTRSFVNDGNFLNLTRFRMDNFVVTNIPDLKVSFKNPVLLGLEQFAVQSVSPNWDDLSVGINYVFEELRFVSDFDVEKNLLVFFVRNSATANVRLTNCLVSLTIRAAYINSEDGTSNSLAELKACSISFRPSEDVVQREAKELERIAPNFFNTDGRYVIYAILERLKVELYAYIWNNIVSSANVVDISKLYPNL